MPNSTRRQRIAAAVVIALIALGLNALQDPPSAQAQVDGHSDWMPFVGEHRMGCTLNNGRGPCTSHHPYWAIDVNMEMNTPIYSAGPGEVAWIDGGCAPAGGDGGCNSRAGNYVAVDHGDHMSRYIHLASFAPGVERGAPIAAGQLVGYAGNSGTTGTGMAHLHYDEINHPLSITDHRFFGPMLACHGDTPVQYPDVLGSTDWQDIDWGVTLRNDGYECLGGVTPKTPPPPPPPKTGPGGSVGLAFGDFDGDQRADLVIGVPGEGFKGKDNAGLSTVVYGSTSASSKVEQLRQIRGQKGLRGPAEAGDMLGAAVATGDFDCDGRDDVAIGVPGEDMGGIRDTGLVSISYGGPSNVANRPVILFQGKWGLPDSREAGDLTGAALAVGDFDNDGCDDLAIGSPGEAIGTLSRAGAVMVAFGQRGGFSASMRSEALLHQGNGLAGFTEANDTVGSSLAAGDFNCDGRSDLAVGVPGESIDGRSRAGAVSITYARPNGRLGSNLVTVYQSSGLAGILEAGDRAGMALAAGDFDNDGCDDLAAGAPSEDLTGGNNAGAVSVSFGSASGLQEGTVHFQGDGGLGGAIEANDFVGAALVAVDLNCDGIDDLAVGSPGEDLGGAVDAGLVSMIRGSNSGLRRGIGNLHQENAIPGTSEEGDAAGSALAAGDRNGDGCEDLAIGIPGEAIAGRAEAGRVVVINGSAAGAAAASNYSQRLNLPGRSEPGDSLGGPGVWDLLGLSLQ
ncbi:MAG: peptidoglycan DD-metalloendopeptidase family protein [Acidimicrobiales bacterium]